MHRARGSGSVITGSAHIQGSLHRGLVASAIVALTWQTAIAQSPTLPDQARDAAERFDPIAAEQVESARQELIRRSSDLQGWLVPGSRKSEGWKRFLRWKVLDQLLTSDNHPRPEQLNGVYDRLTANQPGLEEEKFRAVAGALRQYIDLAAAARRPQARRFHAVQVTGLAHALELYAEDPRPRLEHVIGERLKYLSTLGAYDQLVASVRNEYVRTNAVVTLSLPLLRAVASEPIAEPGTVRDCILGTSIRGTSCTTGRLQVRTLPSENGALVEFFADGQIVSNSRGYNRPVVLRTTGNTRFHVSSVVELSDPVFRVMPARANASTHSTIHSVQAQRRGLLSGVIGRIGTQRAQESKHRSEAIASEHAEARLRNEFRSEVIEGVTKLRRSYRDEYRYPLIRRGEFPEQVRFRSTEDAVFLNLTQANRGQLAAPGSPPPLPNGHDVVACLHQSAASNNAEIMIGGATLAQGSDDARVQLDRELPEWLERLIDRTAEEDVKSKKPQQVESGPQDPWSISLRRRRPLSIGFSDGQMMLIIHMDRFKSGADEFENWDMIFSYELQPNDGGLLLTRRGKIELLPTGFDPHIHRRLSAGHVSVRQNLMKIINDLDERGEGIPMELELPVLTPTGEFSDVGELRLTYADSAAGWLTLAWSLPGGDSGS